ncbi:hypothetical protein ABFB50_07875 [Dehalococcoides sp. THU3]|uniref:hypothetical protein n=1 Tax=Dehalococcoides sp. THU3 TaxID=3151601 RepID=UPI003218AFC7
MPERKPDWLEEALDSVADIDFPAVAEIEWPELDPDKIEWPTIVYPWEEDDAQA